MRGQLALGHFESPLPAVWCAEQVALLTASEHARLERIERPLRREQFVVGHALLRRLLIEAGYDDARIAVEADGRPRLEANTPVYTSIAHSADAVAVIIAGGPVGVDLESTHAPRNPRAAAALLGLPAADASDSVAVVRAWVIAEARLKAGQQALPDVWWSAWHQCQLAAAGMTFPPHTRVFDVMAATYNAVELRWERCKRPESEGR